MGVQGGKKEAPVLATTRAVLRCGPRLFSFAAVRTDLTRPDLRPGTASCLQPMSCEHCEPSTRTAWAGQGGREDEQSSCRV